MYYVKVNINDRLQKKQGTETHGPFKTFDAAINKAQQAMMLATSEHKLPFKLNTASDEIKKHRATTIGTEGGDIVIGFVIETGE